MRAFSLGHTNESSEELKLIVQARAECFFPSPKDIEVAYEPSLECLKRLRFGTSSGVNVELWLGDYNLSITMFDHNTQRFG